MRTLTITIEGRRDGDLDLALEEVKRLVDTGCLSGSGANDTGSFNFEISGDEEAPEDEDA